MDQKNVYHQDKTSSSSVWKLIQLCWKTQRHSSVYISLSVIIIITLSLISLDLVVNYWYYNYFYNALQSYNKQGLINLLSFFLILSACYSILALHRYLVMQLMNREWLSNKRILYFYNYMCAKVIKKTNPPKKMMSIFLNISINFALNFVIATTTFSSLLYYLFLFF
jgi:ABC-type uncharacterized transport system fused permease/ATPase subunit